MKQLRFVLGFFWLFFLSSFVAGQTPHLKWWFNTYDASFGQTAAGDIDHDGKLELVFGCYRNDSCVYALNAEDGTLLWKYNTHPAGYEGCNDVAPIIFDVDGDDSLEVVVPSSCNPVTYCFNGRTGAVKWQTPTYGSDSPPTIADIDNDGKPEILHGEFGGYVICLNGEDGSVAWKIPVDVSTTSTRINTAPTLVDLDNNGQLDFVVASWKGEPNRVFAYRGDNQSLLWTYPLNDWVYHGTAVADLDNDGKPELVIGDYSGKLYVLNGENGSLAWTHTFSAGFYIGAPASIADLDGDGSCEVVISSWYKILALRSDSTEFWNYSIPGYGQSFRGVVLSDVDNDNLPDVIFGTDNGLVIALKGTTGDTLWTMNLEAHYNQPFDIDHAPIIADFDNDDTLDLFIVGGHAEYPDFQNDYGRAYALSIGNGKGPDWLMFQRDCFRQSSLCTDTSNMGVSVPVMDHSVTVFPNPAAGSIAIRFPTREMKTQSLVIMNALGQFVLEFDNLRSNEVIIERGKLKNGLYHFALKDDNGTIGGGTFIIEN